MDVVVSLAGIVGPVFLCVALGMLWAKMGTTQHFTGGTCEGEGTEKRCRLAGVFYNITDERIEWRFNGAEWVFNRLEMPSETVESRFCCR